MYSTWWKSDKKFFCQNLEKVNIRLHPAKVEITALIVISP